MKLLMIQLQFHQTQDEKDYDRNSKKIVRRQVMDAILADSVKSGSRTGLYTVLYAITILAVAVGQFIAAGVFLLSGNRCSCFCVDHTDGFHAHQDVCPEREPECGWLMLMRRISSAAEFRPKASRHERC